MPLLTAGAAFLVPVGDDSAAQWLIDLCLPAGATAPDAAPIAMEHKSHFAVKAATVLAFVSAGLIYLGTRPTKADPDKLLAAMTYMANATPGQTSRTLSRAIERESGFSISASDAAEALATYRGVPARADLDWIASGMTRAQSRRTLSAALNVGWRADGLSRDGLKTIAALAHALGWSGDDLATLLPMTRSAQHSYEPFPMIDSVSHWIFDTLESFDSQRRARHIGVHP